MTDCPTLYPDAHHDNPAEWVNYLKDLLGRTTQHWDGQYDADAVQSVKQFQAEHHLHVDGIVGDQTWTVLRGERDLPTAGTHDVRHPTARDEHAMRFTHEIDYIADGDVLFVRAQSMAHVDPAEGAITLSAEVHGPHGVHDHHLHAVNEPYGGDTRLHTFHLIGVVGDGAAGDYKVLLWLPAETGQDTEQYEFRFAGR
jgi:hypothetical protein